jgi:transcriptional regulator with XRE-family HTH domain
MTFGSFLRQSRQERNLSMGALCAKAGLSGNRLVTLEANKEAPAHQEILRLASALGLPAQTLLVAAGYISGPREAVR